MNRVLKVVVGLIVAAAVVWLLFNHIFPWVDRNLVEDPTLDAAPPPAQLAPSTPAAA